jgi:hypothetical protein
MINSSARIFRKYLASKNYQSDNFSAEERGIKNSRVKFFYKNKSCRELSYKNSKRAESISTKQNDLNYLEVCHRNLANSHREISQTWFNSSSLDFVKNFFGFKLDLILLRGFALSFSFLKIKMIIN